MLGDPVKRLEYVLRNPPEPFFSPAGNPTRAYWALVDTVSLLLLAVEQRERESEIYATIHEMAKHGEAVPVDAIVAAVEDLGNTPYDKFIPWMYREVYQARHTTPASFLWASARFRKKFQKYAPHLPAWQTATKTDVTKMSDEEVFAAVEDWLRLRAEETVYEFPNGWAVKQLIGPLALGREGERMHHCLKKPEYAEDVAAGDKVIYSLRDPRNKPHVTMEWDPNEKRFVQMMMRDDKHPPSEEYRPMLVEFVTQVHGGNLLDLLLTGVPARDLDLHGVDLTGAYLDGARLFDANLTSANLTGAILTGANLTGAKLNGAKLNGAYLFGAKLNGAYLTGADLTRANLAGADLTGAIFDENTVMPDGTRWSPPAGLGYYRRRR